LSPYCLAAISARKNIQFAPILDANPLLEIKKTANAILSERFGGTLLDYS
jgi:hypothetical protein